MNKKHIIIASVAALALVGGFAVYKFSPQKTEVVEIPSEEQIVEREKQVGVVSDTAAQRYTHPTIGFSFSKPEGYTVGSVQGAEATEILLIQKQGENTLKEGMQVAITKIGPDSISLTPDFIQQDLPGTAISDPFEIRLDKKASGIMFYSNNSGFEGSSFEIWFSYGGYAYQATTYASSAEKLKALISTWTF